MQPVTTALENNALLDTADLVLAGRSSSTQQDSVSAVCAHVRVSVSVRACVRIAAVNPCWESACVMAARWSARQIGGGRLLIMTLYGRGGLQA